MKTPRMQGRLREPQRGGVKVFSETIEGKTGSEVVSWALSTSTLYDLNHLGEARD